MANIEEKVERLILKPINDLGYDLYDVEYAKEGKDFFLRIFIDSENGINLEDCEKVNDAITDLLDEADYIKEQYFLEVSSPGIERVLRKDKHLKQNLNNDIQLNLFKPIEGKKQIQGILKDYNDEMLAIENQNQEIKISRKDIALIKTVYEW